MVLKHTKKHTKVQFNVKPMYEVKPDDSVQFLMQRYSFWIATLSILSFVFGNLVGQHGWYAVYKSVMGSGLESQIVYSGTVPPIAQVPNYIKWAQYGGDPHINTFRQVPASVLVPLPPYDAATQSYDASNSTIGQIYSVGYEGSYETGGHGDGYHPGVDIRVPEGTPVQSIANGIVVIAEEKTGYGNTVVVKHPNVPDPKNPKKLITIYSAYAHLSSIHVRIDDIVSKGEVVGLSGNTGNSTGPHLHFQIDSDEAPFHPYWPVQNNASLLAINTIDPMAYVQSNFKPIISSVTTVAINMKPSAPVLTAAQKIAQNRAERIASRKTTNEVRSARVAATKNTATMAAAPSNTVQVPTVSTTTIVKNDAVVSDVHTIVTSGTEVSTIDIKHDGSFIPNEWEKVTLTLKDANEVVIQKPILPKGIYLKTAFGDAEFDKPILQATDFTNGIATVRMRTSSKRTVVIQLQPFGTLARPMTVAH